MRPLCALYHHWFMKVLSSASIAHIPRLSSNVNSADIEQLFEEVAKDART